MPDSIDFIASAKRTIDIERAALAAMSARVEESFSKACRLLLNCHGRIVVLGMGKSGHIGNKIAATLASTGSPAFFVHPAEASHGDMGMITRDDVIIAISQSGTSSEILTLLPLIKRLGVALISFTGNPASPLAKAADVNLDTSVTTEACPLNLAPTSSTTVALVLGDALAIALLEARGFTAEDFAFSHPGGALGRRLLLKVESVMHAGTDLPRVSEDALVCDALLEMSRKGLGMTSVLAADGRLAGIFTDGDLRRALDRGIDVRSTPIATVMTRDARTATAPMLAAEALKIMEEHKINALVVIDEKLCPIGALNIGDLLRAGVL
ncbi:KpsF/GutQ family sugar-phosphate isomerase [Pseudomonas sp. Snoq117.2]|uniref:KpsF/GutQ family sugar-phosphate isomerase n=1 Tax=Pseudomonas sp. Snoq117.2 TaxID=1500302 RepID=UPI000B8787E4|nr:KpsF/GutQ family sugar-phosphate isomerase [Pseudomonas sp. Snoq117.2]